MARPGSLLLALALAATACAPPPRTTVRPDPPLRTMLPVPARAEMGKASWYGSYHHGRRTASGETFDMHQLTAAHPTLPLGTRLRVTNVENGKSVHVRVNDRGPAIVGRIIDLSRAAAAALGGLDRGVFTVRLDVLE